MKHIYTYKYIYNNIYYIYNIKMTTQFSAPSGIEETPNFRTCSTGPSANAASKPHRGHSTDVAAVSQMAV